MTLAEFEAWIATREEAGRAIDVETCELARWPALDEDPYGIRRARGEEPYDQIGTNRWVRSPQSNGWICEDDLPPEKFEAMYDRIHRESEAFDILVKKFENAATTLKVRDETDFDTHIRSSWDAASIIRDAVMDFAVGRGVLDLTTVVHFVLHAIEAGITSGRARRS
jgi:hypothetical protein